MTKRCDFCALNITYPQENPSESKDVDKFFSALRELQKTGDIKKGWPRNVGISNTGIGDKSTICAIDSNHYRPKKENQPCPHFILSAGLSTSDAIALHTARNTDKLTSKIHILTWVILFITAVGVFLPIYPLLSS